MWILFPRRSRQLRYIAFGVESHMYWPAVYKAFTVYQFFLEHILKKSNSFSICFLFTNWNCFLFSFQWEK